MKSFNLKARLLEAKNRATLVLATGVILADKAATDAIEFASDVVEATKETAQDIRRQAGEKVDNTAATLKTKAAAVKEVTTEKIGQLGDRIDEKAAKVSAATAEFGKAAKRTLRGTQEEPQAVTTPAAQETAPKAKKPRARKPRGAAKPKA